MNPEHSTKEPHDCENDRDTEDACEKRPETIEQAERPQVAKSGKRSEGRTKR